MNGKEMELIGRLETKIDFIKSSIQEIKKEQKCTAKRCSSEGERMAKVEQKVMNHVDRHRETNDMSKWRLSLIVAVVSASVSTTAGIIISILT